MTREIVADDLTKASLSARIDYRADVDVVGLIRKYLAEYLAVDMSGGHAPWERPAVFVHEYVAELIDVGFGPDDGKHVHDRSYNDDLDIDFWWTQAHWDALLLMCPEADPEYAPATEDLARKPGPLDVPLPLGGAA